MKLSIILHRFFVRFKNLLRFKEYFIPYEQCDRCGQDYHIVLGIGNELWIRINGREGGCLCPSCFFKIAEDKGIKIELKDIRDLFVFCPSTHCFDIIKNYQSNNPDITDLLIDVDLSKDIINGQHDTIKRYEKVLIENGLLKQEKK